MSYESSQKGGGENEQRGKVKVPFTNCMMSKMEYAIGILF